MAAADMLDWPVISRMASGHGWLKPSFMASLGEPQGGNRVRGAGWEAPCPHPSLTSALSTPPPSLCSPPDREAWAGLGLWGRGDPGQGHGWCSRKSSTGKWVIMGRTGVRARPEETHARSFPASLDW